MISPDPSRPMTASEVRKIVGRWSSYRRRARIVRAARMPCVFGFQTENGEWVSGHTGDWIVEEVDGDFTAVANEEFSAWYTPVATEIKVRPKNGKRKKRP